MATTVIGIRVNEEEMAALQARAGEKPLASYVKDFVFGRLDGDEGILQNIVESLGGAERFIDILSVRTPQARTKLKGDDYAKGQANMLMAKKLEQMLLGTRPPENDPSAWYVVPIPGEGTDPVFTEEGYYVLRVSNGEVEKTITEDDPLWAYVNKKEHDKD